MKFSILTIITVLLIGCGGSAKQPSPMDMPPQSRAGNPQIPTDVPDWFMMTPEEDDEYLYATGQADSRKMNIALQKASQQARMNLGQQINNKTKSLIENMQQESGMGDNVQITSFYSEASKSVSNETLRGAKVLKKYPYRTPNGGYTAYVLMGMKKKAFDNSAAKAITSMVNQNKEEAMYAEFKKTQAFSRLEAEVAD
tara:strand:+ start:145 stop:738 length:594 start_codon:yes stop_codon:yes gene_type:complete